VLHNSLIFSVTHQNIVSLLEIFDHLHIQQEIDNNETREDNLGIVR